MRGIKFLCGAVLMTLSLQVAGQGYQVRLTGFRQLSEVEVAFGIQIRNAGQLPWAYNAGQYGVVFDSLSLRGGILQGSLQPAGSSLPVGQLLREEDVFWSAPYGVLTCSAPPMAAGSPLMLLNHQQWLTIATLVVGLKDASGSTFIAFADGLPRWSLRQAGTRVFAADYYLEDGLALRGQAPGVPGYSRQLTATSGNLIAMPVSRQLAGSWFYGEGRWDDPERWNVLLRGISPAWQPQLPAAASNVQVAGAVTLAGGLLVTLQPDPSGRGGQLVVGEVLDGQAPPSLTIAPRAGLKVAQLFNDQGAEAIAIEASAAGSGWLIHDNEGAQARVECYLEGPSGRAQAFRLMASPVEDGRMADFALPPGSQPPVIWRWMPRTGLWEPADAAHDTFVRGHGYRVAVTREAVGVFAGMLTANDVVRTGLSHDSGEGAGGHPLGWHLLGNPFASPLSWDPQLWQLNNICHTASTYDGRAGSYRLLRAGHQAVIGVSEGFFIHAEQGPPGSLVMPAAARLPGTPEGPATPPDQIVLTATHLQQGLVQPTIIAFDGAATGGYDITLDAPFLGGEAPWFYSARAGRQLALNTLPEATPGLVVPLGFEAHAAGSYAIGLQQELPGVPLTLYDRQLQVSRRLTPGGRYVFEGGPQDGPARFELHLAAAPVGAPEPPGAGMQATLSGGRLCLSGRAGEVALLEVFAMDGRLLVRRVLQPLAHQCLAVPAVLGPVVVRVSGAGGPPATLVLVNGQGQ